MRTTAPVAAATLALAAAAHAQVAVFSNGSADPNAPALAPVTTTASGVAAAPGTFWSEVPSDATGANAVGGFSCHKVGGSGAYRFADDFTVPAGGWRISGASFYAYEPGSGPAASPFMAINVRVWRGRPGDPGSTVVAGDTTTNRMTASTSTGIYRVFNTTAQPVPPAPDTTRLIWRTDADLGSLVLAAGTYWLDWQYTAAVADAEAYSPAVTVPGSRSGPGWNGRQFNGAAWVSVADMGKTPGAAPQPQDLPFILRGSTCLADMDDGSGQGHPDGGVTIDDLLYYIVRFNAGC